MKQLQQVLEMLNGFQISATELKIRNCNSLMMEAIDQAFYQTLGKNLKSVYLNLETNYGIVRGEIPDKIEEFTNALEQMFGFNALILEIEVMKEIHVSFPSFKYKATGDLIFTSFLKSLKVFLDDF